MAFPAVPAPYGFRAVNSADGKPYAGATRQLKLANTRIVGGSTVTTAVPIFYGDLVTMAEIPDADGARIIRMADDSGTYFSEAPTPYGVFMGCTFTNPTTKQPTFSQFWPGPTAAPDAIGYIIDDPMALFQVVVTDTTDTTTAAVTEAQYWAIGMNANVSYQFLGENGSTNTGNSLMSILPPSNSNSYAGLVRIVEVVPATETPTGYPELRVILRNPGLNAITPSPARGQPLLT
jgi:hypothetical protein